jgi:SAM-dependent methyltransferase
MAWYEEFFGEDYMWFWLRGGEEFDQRAPAECDFVISTLGLGPGARILDLCCGQGRHAVELAKRGFQVSGLDLSEYLLAIARNRAAGMGVNVEFVRGDMREIPWEGEFDAVVNLFTAFGYLESDGEDEKVIHRVARCLRPGGKFLLDLINRPRIMEHFQATEWSEHEDHIVLHEREWDEITARITCETTVVTPAGDRRKMSHRLRMYAHAELVSMLGRAGLERLATYGDLEGAEYSMESRRMVVVARKPEEAAR